MGVALGFAQGLAEHLQAQADGFIGNRAGFAALAHFRRHGRERAAVFRCLPVALAQIGVDERWQWILPGKNFFAEAIEFLARIAQGGLDQVVLGLEVGIKAAMGQAQRFHQRLQAGGTDAIAAKARRCFLDDPLVGLGFVVLRIAHGRRLREA
ncbi:hypothetical protein D3C80_1178180 [compost metagenome]